jgi:methyl-accepting chemotaxis protein
MGHIQNTGGLLTDPIFAEAPPMLSVLAKFMPGFGIKQLATRSIGWWVQTADLPDLNNRVQLQGNKINIDYTPNNTEVHDRLIYRWIEITIETELKDIFAKIDQRLDRMEQGQNELKLSVSELKGEVKNLSTELKGEIKNLNTEVKNIGTKVDDLQRTTNKLDEEIEDSKQDISDLKGFKSLVVPI